MEITREVKKEEDYKRKEWGKDDNEDQKSRQKEGTS